MNATSIGWIFTIAYAAGHIDMIIYALLRDRGYSKKKSWLCSMIPFPIALFICCMVMGWL